MEVVARRGLMLDPARFERDVLQPIHAVVGDGGMITDRDEMQPLLRSWRDNWVGRTPLIVRPADTQQMAAVVAICHRTRTPMVPQGANTGVTGAGQPHDDDTEVVLSTSRMNRIRGIDVDNDTMTVDAGCILASVQEAALGVGRLFPLSLGAEGSCQIGGNISTNAGGVKALRYGTARSLVAGLEVVLPDGQVWDGLQGLRKDNAGYDLKQLFIGAEGTLGIITGATLKLLPRPSATVTAFLATPSPTHAVAWLRQAKATLGETLASCELLERRCIDFAMRGSARVMDPLADRHPWYILVELSDQGTPDRLEAKLLAAMEKGFEDGTVVDGALAASTEQAANFWRIREGAPARHAFEGVSFKHDVSVPISQIARFITEADAELSRRFPGIRSFSFGHLGDGNIHYNPIQAEGEPAELWYGRLAEINRIVHDLIAQLGGSITAEHGVGRLRTQEMLRYKSAVEMGLMAGIKRWLDPLNLMNPGKLLTADFLSGSPA